MQDALSSALPAIIAVSWNPSQGSRNHDDAVVQDIRSRIRRVSAADSARRVSLEDINEGPGSPGPGQQRLCAARRQAASTGLLQSLCAARTQPRAVIRRWRKAPVAPPPANGTEIVVFDAEDVGSRLGRETIGADI